MWIPKWIVQQWQAQQVEHRTLSALLTENATVRGKNAELEKRALAAEITNDWLRARLNQVEAERAMLLSKQTGIPFGAPVITPAGSDSVGDGTAGLLDDLSFEDVGDERARQLGLDDEGG